MAQAAGHRAYVDLDTKGASMTKTYPLESSERERRRLKLQGDALIPLTERMLELAGVGPGSRVLELGCGGGDVTLLLGRRVGRSGSVLAIDSNREQIDYAEARVTEAGLRNVTFAHVDLNEFNPTERYDAVVGRYILIYVENPEKIVERASQWVVPGGAMAFLEMNFFRGVRSTIWPQASAMTNRAIEFIADVMLDAGIIPHMAARLPSMLARYGRVQTETAAPLQFGASSVELPLEAVRSVIPVAHKLGRIDADYYDVDALLADELVGRDHRTVTVPPLSVVASVRL
jgi:ubiquinone/menaquinone biosynthesis C-methylase UbiE